MTTPAELRSQLEVKGAEINLLTNQIENRLNQLKDWRNTVEEFPLRSIATAIGAGLLVSGLAFPMARNVGKQVGFAAKASLTAYLTAVFTNKLHELTEH